MAVFMRAKRVSDPLDEKARARICGDGCSCCRSAANDLYGSSSHLSCLVQAFLEHDDPADDLAAADLDGGDSEESDGGGGGRRVVSADEMVRDLLGCSGKRKGDRFRSKLLAEASAAEEAVRSSGPAAHRRAVAVRLRDLGYNAGVCTARWETCGGLSGGSYEYIDVVASPQPSSSGSEDGDRFIVDLGFAGEFEIARPTEEYAGLVAELPVVVVARPEEMRQAIRILADAARRSMKSQGLHVPPWRKNRYMIAKWLGPYRRTVNLGHGGAASAASEIKCRAVGFRVAPPPGFLLPQATRTR